MKPTVLAEIKADLEQAAKQNCEACRNARHDMLWLIHRMRKADRRALELEHKVANLRKALKAKRRRKRR